MRIPITCPGCGNDFSAPESMVGRKAVCPECKSGVRVTDAGNGLGAGSGSRSRSANKSQAARGGSKGLKTGLFIVLGLAAVLGIALAMENLPSLTQMNLASQSTPGPSAGDPAPPESAIPQPVEEPPDPGKTEPPPEPEDKPVPPSKKPPKDSPKAPPKPNRSQAAKEFDTDRGRLLLAQTKHVVLAREGKVNKNQDPKLAIWNETVANGRRMIEKLGLEFSQGNPGPQAAVLSVTLTIQPTKKGTPGTKELSISAELTCADPSADSASGKYAKVWRAEQDLGTISAKASKAGKLPNSVEEQITKFFGKFRSAYQQAVQATKDLPAAASRDS